MKNALANEIQTYILTELKLDECTIEVLTNLSLKQLVKYWVQKNELELSIEKYNYKDNKDLIQLGIALDIPGMKEREELYLSEYKVDLNASFQVSGIALEELKSHLSKLMGQKKLKGHNPSYSISEVPITETSQDALLGLLPDINLGIIKKADTANKHISAIKKVLKENTELTQQEIDEVSFSPTTEGLKKAKEMLISLIVKVNVKVS